MEIRIRVVEVLRDRPVGPGVDLGLEMAQIAQCVLRLRMRLRIGADFDVERVAVLGADDRAALVALDVCREMGRLVPADVKVVGIDDVPQARFAQPPLSTFRQPLDEMAACAVDNLIDALNGKVEKNCVNPQVLNG